jgi:hypothetical protein
MPISHQRANAARKISDITAKEVKKGDKKSVDPRASEFNPIEPARAYGVTKKEVALYEKLKLKFFQLIGLAFFCTMLSIVVLGTLAFLLFGNILVSFLITVITTVALLFIFTKPLRKRARFIGKLKRLCKKNNYKLKFEQGFFSALVWSPDRIDLSVNTGRYTYLVHLLTVRKYRSSITFCDKHNFYRTKFPPPNVFTIILGLRPKVRDYTVSFPEPYTIGEHKNINAIIVNPVCSDLYMKNKDGVTEPTGSGAECFGYSIFTGSGFLEAIVRNEKGSL